MVCRQGSCIVYDNYSECECMDIVQMLDETIHLFTNIQQKAGNLKVLVGRHVNKI